MMLNLGTTSVVPGQDNNKENIILLKYIFNIFAGYIMIVILSVGLLGNLISLSIFLRIKRKNDATTFYLSWLAVSDSACIVFVGFVMWMANGLKGITDGNLSLNLYYSSRASCKGLMYAYVTMQAISAWIIMVFNVETAIVVWYPLARLKITQNIRRLVFGIVIGLCCIVCIYSGVMSDLFPMDDNFAKFICYYPQTGAVVATLLITENMLYYFFPCGLITVANTIIVSGIVKSKRLKENVGLSKKDFQERKSLVNLFAISLLYIVFMTPNSILTVYFFLNSNHSQAEFIYILSSFAQQFSNLNYCVNFIVYGFSLPFYRREVGLIFHRCHEKLSR
jgi:hypothetical protein